ncbi:MAG TPA: PQQ-dependent sugar dehydrogenase [Thermoleophilaceae bacterium]
MRIFQVLRMALVATALALALAVPARATDLPAGFGEQVLADGLPAPTSVAWAPDGRMFVSGKNGQLFVVDHPGDTPKLVLDISAHVNDWGDRGLNGIAVDKDFATNHTLWMVYVYEPIPMDDNGPKVSRLSSIQVNDDDTLVNPSNPETVVLGGAGSTQCPAASNTSDCIPADATIHSIGTVRSDPADGTLWLGSGDGTENIVDDSAYRTYDEQSFAGKLIHVGRDGKGLPGHPFCPSDTNLDHVCTKIYAKGFRNPFRFTLRPGKGPAVGDVGSSSFEELDLVKPGKDYGWPCYEAEIRTPNFSDTDRCADVYAGNEGAKTSPNYDYSHDGGGAAIVPGPFYPGGDYPDDFDGQMFLGDYAKTWINRLNVGANDNVTEGNPLLFAGDWANGGVDLELAPGTHHLVYVDIASFGGDGEVREIVPTTGNTPPVARMTPADGASSTAAPLTVDFSASSSSDPDPGDSITSYHWTFGDGDSSTEESPSHTYTSQGSFTAKVIVTDSHGSSASAKAQITVGHPPEATMLEPTDGFEYTAGTPITLDASTSDPDGDSPGVIWHVILHHNTHIHDLGIRTDNPSEVTAPTDHGADSYLEIKLTARDASGIETTVTREIHPKTQPLMIKSDPSGAAVSYAQLAYTAPQTIPAVVGSILPLSAGASLTSGGKPYDFLAWSDLGARAHNFQMPDHAVTVTAHYKLRPTPPHKPAPPATTPTPTTPSPKPAPDDTHIRIGRKRLKLGSRRRVRVLLRCLRPSGSCRGEVAIHSARKTRSARHRTYGKARFRIKAGARGVIHVRLTRKAARLLRKRGKLRVSLAAVTRDLSGHRKRSSRTLLLRD